MIEKIQEKIEKYRISRSAESIYMSRAESVLKFNLICEFIIDLEKLIESAEEKKKACCEKKLGKGKTKEQCDVCGSDIPDNFNRCVYCDGKDYE